MRVFLIVLDGVGIGASQDCTFFNDPPTVNTTLNSIKKAFSKNFKTDFPNLSKLGLHKILQIKNPHLKDQDLENLGFNTNFNTISSYGIMKEKSKGKDTITGHWEIAGIILEKGFDTFSSFPQELIKEFEQRINKEIIGNKAASGTEIIKELGEEHLKTGKIIVYTSADSVFQVAAHVDVIKLEELYRICQIAYDLIQEKGYRIARVIARPFAGEKDNFYRLNELRKDFAVPPPSKTILDILYESGLQVITVGKVADIFAHRSITRNYKISGNRNIFYKTVELAAEEFEGLVFSNLVDFDTVYGHRQDYLGWVKALKEFDQIIPDLINKLKENDLLIITADHGNDPTDNSTDHTREDVPLICITSKINPHFLGIKESYRYVSFLIQNHFKEKLIDKLEIKEYEQNVRN
ncbi:MAG: phosphopentomutase [bacterium]